MKGLLVAIGILGMGCYQSWSDGDGGAEDGSIDTGDDARDATDARDLADRLDVPLPDGAECVTDDDCVVALEVDRCCTPNPVAISRERLATSTCLRELGTVWGDEEPGCRIPCEACQPITRRYYAARCDAGTCVGVEDFCEATMPVPPSAGEFQASVTPRGGWEQYRGQVVTVQGWDMLGLDSCACCFGCMCDCFDTPVQHSLDCTMTLRGSTCGTPWSCTGDECTPSCSPPYPMGPVLTEGYLVDAEEGGWEVWPTAIPGDCPPAGPNPAGAPCDVMGDDSYGCADGLVCFYWGDVLSVCDGECRPYGTECTVDDDCDGDDVCHLGYCVWCCPG